MTTSTDTRKDRHGFPIRDCSRCGGTGSYSYNQIDGSRCYGCGGTGVVHPRGKVTVAFAAFAAAVRAQRSPVVAALAIGDVITFDLTMNGGIATGATWAEVAQLEVDESRVMGSTGVNAVMYGAHKGLDHDSPRKCSECWAPTAWAARITYVDGTVEDVTTNSMCKRRGAVDAAPFLAQAGIKS